MKQPIRVKNKVLVSSVSSILSNNEAFVQNRLHALKENEHDEGVKYALKMFTPMIKHYETISNECLKGHAGQDHEIPFSSKV